MLINNYYLNPLLVALIAGIFTYLFTLAGASIVLFTKEISKKFMDIALGFAAGIMIAASFWSLLQPALKLSALKWGGLAFFPVAISFLVGGFFLKIIDWIIPHLHFNTGHLEGPPTKWHKSILLVTALTIHNIPEGLAIGVAFGALGGQMTEATLDGAVSLALGIGIQNFPEGLAVALPLRGAGLSRGKSFFWGQLSGIVEPIAAVIGAALVYYISGLLPYALAFAAGAMIFVVVEEVIPESQSSGHGDWATLGCLVGFALMMSLDVALS